ncbi:MAG: YihY/virulence factor BrkB family protein [Gemmatimonadota bacterium]
MLRGVADGVASFFRKHGLVYSAAVAFNLLLSAIPVLFLVFAATSLFIRPDDLPFAQLANLLRNTFPYGAQVLVPVLKGLFASRATFGAVGVVLLMYSSWSATDAVHTSLAVMLEKRRGRRFGRSLLFHVVLVLALTILAFGAILVPPVWKGIMVLSREMVGREFDAAFHLLLQSIARVALAGIVLLGGALSYRYLSPGAMSWRHAFGGSAAFTLLLYAIKFGFTFYIRKFSRLNVIYGSLFTIICFIIVAYLFAAAYLLCASVIGALERQDEGEGASPEEETGAGSADTARGR